MIQLFIVNDPIAYILAKPAVHQPGTYWYYSGGDVNLLGEIIRKATGMRMDDLRRSTCFHLWASPKLVNERGWRRGFANLLRKENSTCWGTRRW